MRRLRAAAVPYLLLLPAIVALAAVSLYPTIDGVRASLHRYRYALDTGYTGGRQFCRRLRRCGLLEGDGDDGSVHRLHRLDRDPARPPAGAGRRPRIALRGADPRDADPADDDRAGRRRRHLAAALCLRHRGRRSAVSGAGVRRPERARPWAQRLPGSRRRRCLGMDTADVPDHPRRLAFPAAGSDRSGPRRWRQRDPGLLSSYAAAAAPRAAGGRRAAHDRCRRHVRPGLCADQGRAGHGHPAHLDLCLQHRIPVQPVRPRDGDADHACWPACCC